MRRDTKSSFHLIFPVFLRLGPLCGFARRFDAPSARRRQWEKEEGVLVRMEEKCVARGEDGTIGWNRAVVGARGGAVSFK